MANKQTGDPLNPHTSYTERQWQKKFFAMGAKCYYCENPLPWKEATKDHKTPTCRGGVDRLSNIVPCCRRCNSMKGWRTEAEFLAYRLANNIEFSKFPQPHLANPLNLAAQAQRENISLRKRDEPPLSQLRREAEGGCPLAFKSRSL